MTSNSTDRQPGYVLAITSTLLVSGICICLIFFINQFLQYALNMFYLAAQETTRLLQIIPHH